MAEHISRAIKKATEVIDRLAAKAPEKADVIEENEQSINTELTSKYQSEIDDLDSVELEAWNKFSVKKKNAVLGFRAKMDTNRYFKTSRPRIDMLFMVMLANNHSITHIRERLTNAHKWLVANSDKHKKNYRRFLLNFMTDRPYAK